MALLIFMLLPILAISSIEGISNIQIHQPSICLKNTCNVESSRSINTWAMDFKDFVRSSHVFVDKSLLVSIVAQNATFVSLTYPRKWGKTINLDMLKTFLEIEVDFYGKAKPSNVTWSYNFFKQGKIRHENGTFSKLMHPPMIGKNDTIVNSYLSQYPVIHLNLSYFNPTSLNFEGFVEIFKERVTSAFKKHEYIIDILGDNLDDSEVSSNEKLIAKNHRQTLRKYNRGNIDSDEDLITSLKFLSSLLKRHFNKQVYILIDDYDAPVRKTFLDIPSPTNKEAERIMDFLYKFISSSIEKNENVRMGIETGVLDLDILGHRGKSIEYVNYNLLNKNTRPFYGFTTSEVGQLLSCVFVQDEVKKKAMKYYDGYRFVDFPEMTIYNPWSIVNFANFGKIFYYQANIVSFEITSLLSCKHVTDVVKKHVLAVDSVVETSLHNLKFSIENVTMLKNIINGIELPQNYNAKIADLIFRCFYAFGYFTLHLPMESTIKNINGLRKIKTPNEDLKNGIIFIIDAITHQFLRIFQLKEFKDLGLYVNDIDQLQRLYKIFIPAGKCIYKLDDLRPAHAFLLGYWKSNYDYNVNFEVSYVVGNHTFRPYIVLQKQDHRVIIEFNINDLEIDVRFYERSFISSKRALNRAKSFNNIFKNELAVSTSFVGIGVDAKEYSTRIQIDTNPEYNNNELI